MFDSHVHTKFSPDSVLKIEEAIEKSNEEGLGLIITEHMDYDYPEEDGFHFNPEDYFKEYEKYRGDKLLLGVEIGIRDCNLEKNKKLNDSFPFDYIIGSVHVIDGVDIYNDPDIYEKISKKDLYTMYLEQMAHRLKQHDFVDSLGHIDYLARYANYSDPEIYYNDFAPLFDEVFKTAIDRGIVLELNTKRLKSERTYKSMIDIYKRYRELGGREITVGSDSHFKDAIGFEFKAAKEIAEECNLKIVYFKNRKMEYV